MTRYRDTQMSQPMGRQTAPKGRCTLHPFLIVSKEEVGEGQYLFRERNAEINRAQSLCTLSVLDCRLVITEQDFCPSAPYPCD